MKVYNKLVRDKIPSICIKNNQIPITKTLNDSEYLTELNLKLQEELKEYLESGEIEELADLEEVLIAILDTKNIPYHEFEKIREEKVQKRGAFKNRTYLLSVEDNK